MADLSKLSDEEIIRNLPDDVLMSKIAGNQESPQPSVQPSTNMFESPAARLMFPGIGGVIGATPSAIIGGAATAPAGGVGAIPSAAAGGALGAASGESLRQFLASATGGYKPKTVLEGFQSPSVAGLQELAGHGVANAGGAALNAMGSGIKLAGRYAMRNIPDPVLSWVKEQYQLGKDVLDTTGYDLRTAVLDAGAKLGSAIKTVRGNPALVEHPSPTSLYPTAEKAANAFEVLRENITTKYGAVAEKAQEKPLRVSMTDAFKSVMQELQSKGIIDSKGNPIRLGDRGFTSEESGLLNLFNDMASLRPTGQTITEGLPGEATYSVARRILDRMDEASGSLKTRAAKRVVLQARDILSKGIKASDQEIAKVIPEYSDFVDMRDMLEPAFHDPDKAVSLLTNSMKDTRRGLAAKLKALSDNSPDELKFYGDLVDYQNKITQARLAKTAPDKVSKFISSLDSPQKAERLIMNIFNDKSVGETSLMELEALENASGIPFLDEFRGIAAKKMFSGTKPTMSLPSGAAHALIGAPFYMAGGLPAAALGTGLGVSGGIVSSIPQVQGQILRKALPVAIAAQRAGQAAAPSIPPAIAAIIRSMQSNNNGQ